MEGTFVEVGVHDGITVEYPDKVVTDGIGPCMAIGIYDHGLKKGYLGHYVLQDKTVESLVDKAVQTAADPNDLEVLIVGNVPPTKDLVALTDDSFPKIVDAFHAHARWVNSMVLSKGVRLDRFHDRLQYRPGDESYELIVDTEIPQLYVKKNPVIFPEDI